MVYNRLIQIGVRLATLMAVLALYSCVKNEFVENKQAVLTFSATHPDIVSTKVTGLTWQNGDQIGIFMVRESAPGEWETVVDEAFNKCYTTTGDGVFTPATVSDQIIAPKDAQKVNFVAYYPYRSDIKPVVPCVYGVDMSLGGDDCLLISRNLQNVNVTGKPLTLEFSRPLSMLHINVASQFDASLMDGMVVSVSGSKYSKGDYALLRQNDNFLALEESVTSTKATVSTLDDGSTVADVVLLPSPNVLLLGGKLIFELKDSKVLSHTLASDIALEAGKRHIYNILLRDAGATQYFEVLPADALDAKLEGESRSVMILSREPWTMNSCPGWVGCLPAQGVGGEHPENLTLTFATNYSGEVRTGEIVFQDTKGAQLRMPVSQSYFNTTIFDARFLMDGGLGILGNVTTYPARDINPNMLQWTYNATWQGSVCLKMEPQTWIRYSTQRPYLTPLSGRVIVSIDNNTSSEPREVILRLEDYYANPIKFFKIVQQGATDYLELSVSNFNSRAKGDLFGLVVTSRYDWTVEDLPDWVTLTKGTTVANKTMVTLSAAANSGAARSASIRIVSGSLSRTIELNQAAKVVQSYPFKLSYAVVVHAFGSQETGFRFNGLDGLQDVYANLVHIMPRPASDGTIPEEVRSYSPYGYVIDPPVARQMKSDPVSGGRMFINYYGSATSVEWIDIAISYAPGWTYIRRANIKNLPVPGGLNMEDRLIFTVKMTDIVNSEDFKYSVTHEIK